MLRFLADENLSGDVVRALRLRLPEIDLVRVQDVGLQGADDPTILAWAATQVRIVLTHDRATMPRYAYERVVGGAMMVGVVVVNNRLSGATAVDDLAIIACGSEAQEWTNLVLYLPL